MSPVNIGAAAAEITPPIGLAMDGYGARASGAVGIHDPLFVRVLVAEGAEGSAVVLVVADLLYVVPHLQAMVAAGIERATGIGRDRLQLVGTHTHSGPACSSRPKLSERSVGRSSNRGASLGRAAADASPRSVSVGWRGSGPTVDRMAGRSTTA